MAAQLVPSNNPTNKRTLSLGTRLSLFSEVIELCVTVFVVSNFHKGLQDILHYYSFKILALQTHLKYHVENELKQTAEAFDDHYDQTEVQSILA